MNYVIQNRFIENGNARQLFSPSINKINGSTNNVFSPLSSPCMNNGYSTQPLHIKFNK